MYVIKSFFVVVVVVFCFVFVLFVCLFVFVTKPFEYHWNLTYHELFEFI